MFRYKVNSKLLPALRLISREPNNDVERNISTEPPTHEDSQREQEKYGVKYPLFKNVRTRVPKAMEPINQAVDAGEAEKEKESELDINVNLDFGWLFGWLERGVWVTMFGGVIWALAHNFSRATREPCTIDGSKEHFPYNVLPSLSRSMSSFRVGKFFWTIIMAAVFVGRLLSNHFLHRLYDSWYAPTVFNKIFLWIAYSLDTLEILSLIMIPAFSLDCDPTEHRVLFILFLSLTYTAELVQYFTKFLKRRKGLCIFCKDVNRYYKQIGILILCQTFFILFMFTGYFLHVCLCGDFYYSIFALGEYLTVVVNVRFKRDTVLFVK